MPKLIKKFFAIAHAKSPHAVLSLCEVTKRHNDGSISAEVVNGAYDITLNSSQDFILIESTSARHEIVVVWSDDRPPYVDYNAAIERINQIINPKPETK